MPAPDHGSLEYWATHYVMRWKLTGSTSIAWVGSDGRCSVCRKIVRNSMRHAVSHMTCEEKLLVKALASFLDLRQLGEPQFLYLGPAEWAAAEFLGGWWQTLYRTAECLSRSFTTT